MNNENKSTNDSTKELIKKQDFSKRIIIRSEKQTAELWQGGTLRKTYLISTALNGLGCSEGSYCTPYGKLRVLSKIGEGLPMGAVFRSRVATGEIWPNNSNHSDEDLVLTRVLWLEGVGEHNLNTQFRFIYLHGTNHESMLGKAVSHGCIRFSNKDILELYDSVDVGTEVEVV